MREALLLHLDYFSRRALEVILARQIWKRFQCAKLCYCICDKLLPTKPATCKKPCYCIREHLLAEGGLVEKTIVGS
jgi:hypothetical protein